MGLAGWNANNRLKLTIDNSKIDGALTAFPVLITLSSGSGQTGFDATAVFDELATASGSYDNRKKIAVTTTISGVETELYVEIETWDDTTASGNEQAWLWAKVPTIVSDTDTDLYLYYDSNHTTNSGYIGDTGDTPAQNVWDNTFIGVWHMDEDPNGDVADAIKDSTSSANHGSPAGSMTSDDLVSAKINGGIDFDGGNDYLAANGNNEAEYSLSVIMKRNGSPGAWEGMIGFSNTSSQRKDIAIDATGHPTIVYPTSYRTASVVTVTDNQYYHVYGTYDGATGKMYVNGQNIALEAPAGAAAASAASILRIADMSVYTYYFQGIIDEARVYNEAKSPAWITADYHSNWDDLITFSMAGEFGYYFSGDVYELENTISGAQIFVYRRDTGAYAGSTTSSGDGGFYVETSYSGSHFLVCLDPAGGQSYNDLIYGDIIPVIISN